MTSAPGLSVLVNKVKGLWTFFFFLKAVSLSVVHMRRLNE